MAAQCVNVNVIGKTAAQPASRDLPATDLTAVNAAITTALSHAGPTYDSTNDIKAIQTATRNIPVNYIGHVHVIWDPAIVTLNNQLRAALRMAAFMMLGDASMKD